MEPFPRAIRKDGGNGYAVHTAGNRVLPPMADRDGAQQGDDLPVSARYSVALSFPAGGAGAGSRTGAALEGFFGRERVGAQHHQCGADGCQRVLPVYALGGTDRAAAPAAEAVVPGQRAGADAEGIYAAGADGGEAGEKPAVADHAEHLRDRDPDFGTAVSDGGGAAHRTGDGGLQGEKQGCADPERAEADADAVCEGEGDPVGPGFCHKKRPACRPVERMARDEKALPAGGRQCQEGVPAQSAASLCRDLLDVSF